MIKRTLALAFAATMALTMNSCQNKKTTASGLEYEFITDEEGPVAKNGEKVSFHLLIRNEKDSVVYSTYTNGGIPTEIVLDTARMRSMKDSFITGVALMSKGDSVDFFVSSKSLLETSGFPAQPFIKEGPKHRITVKLVNITAQVDQNVVDQKLIQEYIVAKKLNAVPTASGLYYAQTKPGTGKKVEKGNKVKVHYVGTLLTGMEFDNSVKRGEPIELQVGVGQVIPGWDEGLQLMSEGEKGILIIPSQLAYGPQGKNPIPPNAVLAFELEMISATK